MTDEFLSTPLQFVKGVGPRRAADFQRVGVCTVEDLLLRLPRRYENRAEVVPIARIRPGQHVTVIGEVVTSGIRPTRRPAAGWRGHKGPRPARPRHLLRLSFASSYPAAPGASPGA